MGSVTRGRAAAGFAFAAACGMAALLTAQAPSSSRLPLSTLKLPPGFSISVYAENVPNARSMALAPGGTLFVGTRTAGNVYAIVDADKDQKADKVVTIATGLDMPNGVAVRNGSLYVAEVSRILRFDNIEAALDKPPAPVVVTDAYPKDRHHGWKFIAFGPDGLLYVPVGAPCNVCERADARYASITRIKPDGSDLEVFASGVRNTVGFDWHPVTKELWFTDNGRDMMGDDVPPDEAERRACQGLALRLPVLPRRHHRRPRVRREHARARISPRRPARSAPHVAALGMRFYTGTMFPAALPESDPDCRARLVEPQHTDRLPAHEGHTRRKPRHRVPSRSSRAGCRAGQPGAAPWTSWSCPTGLCSSPTTTPARSTASVTPADRAGGPRPAAWAHVESHGPHQLEGVAPGHDPRPADIVEPDAAVLEMVLEMHVRGARRERVGDLGEGEIVRGHEPDRAVPDQPAEHRLGAGSPIARIGAVEHLVEEEQQRRTSPVRSTIARKRVISA